MPKYGFPVDVVSLQLLYNNEPADKLKLERDLRIALSEYAPGSEIVAGGFLWTSHGIKRLPDRAWPKYQYAICPTCQRYQSIFDPGELPEKCDSCDQPLEGKQNFIVPEFGFSTNIKKPKKPGRRRPRKTYTTRVYFSGKSLPSESSRVLRFKDIKLEARRIKNGKLAVVNRSGFKVCHKCGYATDAKSNNKATHETPFLENCSGFLTHTHLGHEFLTDILDLRFIGHSSQDKSFWYSLLYALLEGAAVTLNITSKDLNGCLYPYSHNTYQKAIILFDDVPGGAGHVHRLGEDDDLLNELLINATKIVQGGCRCGSETSCYGCLRSYRNQYYHDSLKRGLVLDFLKNLI